MNEVYKERMLYALKELEVTLNSIHMLRHKLLGMFEEKFPEYDAIKQEENMDMVLISSIENLLMLLHSKLSTIAYFYEMVLILERTVTLLRVIKDDMNELLPVLDLVLDNIATSFAEIKAILGIDNNDEAKANHMF